MARQASVVTGGLLVFWSVMAWLYVLLLRAPPENCLAGQVAWQTICVNTWPWILPITVIGVLLMIFALLTNVKKPKNPAHLLRPGSFTRLTFAVPLSLAAGCFVALLWVLAEQGDGPAMTWRIAEGDILWEQTFILGILTGLGLSLFLVAYFVHLGYVVRKGRFISAMKKSMRRQSAAPRGPRNRRRRQGRGPPRRAPARRVH